MSPSLAVGEFANAPPNASRSPCPVVNALANHGYLDRSGRKIYMSDLNASMRHVGMSPLLGSVFAIPTYFEYHDPKKAYMRKDVSVWQRVWGLIKNPYSFFDYFGCWNANQVINGKKYLNLVDLASHGAIEHDISLSRRDFGQKEGNNDPQKDLIEDMLQYTFDGKRMNIENLGDFVKARIQRQLKDNPDLVYGPAEHQVNCGQLALMMGCFGDGKTISVDYVRAIFQEERLPYQEGWTRRYWWTMGLLEFFGSVKRLIRAVGIDI
ncbi:chloroperoxidase [Fusarium heterosporum]|uniref:Chloroperoxidase n=1 Tax=Fusarium heterosporum TaxID=42747 RepID=A0A8H5TUL8_FUSHE|nr:chloroperoxidase [Fusarium heterosporum]